MKLIRTLILTGLLGLIALLGAAPLSMTPVQVTQPDGTELNIFASGDEFHNWLHDADRYTILCKTTPATMSMPNRTATRWPPRS